MAVVLSHCVRAILCVLALLFMIGIAERDTSFILSNGGCMDSGCEGVSGGHIYRSVNVGD